MILESLTPGLEPFFAEMVSSGKWAKGLTLLEDGYEPPASPEPWDLVWGGLDEEEAKIPAVALVPVGTVTIPGDGEIFTQMPRSPARTLDHLNDTTGERLPWESRTDSSPVVHLSNRAV